MEGYQLESLSKSLKQDGIAILSLYDTKDIHIPSNMQFFHGKKHKTEANVNSPPLVDELLPLVTEYFGHKPNSIVTRVIHTFPTPGGPVGSQNWHRDKATVGVFVYLTDVDIANGPFCYIRGSQQSLGTEYPEDDQLTLLGPKGTSFIADLTGYHRGLKPTLDRYMLGIFYGDYDYPKRKIR